jgi:hypothetical protein
MGLIEKDLSEPYSIFTYRYFINDWPSLCILVCRRREEKERKGKERKKDEKGKNKDERETRHPKRKKEKYRSQLHEKMANK